AVSAVSQSLLLTLPAFVVGGACWVLMLSTLNITVQMSAPRWVVGRALATYHMVTFGGLALGSWMWGELAASWGLMAALLASGAALGVTAFIGAVSPLPQAEALNLSPLRPAPEKLPAGPGEDDGPVVITVEYRIAPEDRDDFVAAMRELRRIRRRDGARRWTLMQDLQEPDRWIERFHSPSWIEHLRHYHRITVADAEIERRALAFHRGPEPPRVRYLLERPTVTMDERKGEERLPAVEDPNLPASTLRS